MEQLPIDISPGCILRAATQGDRWQLQKLVLRFIKEEVLSDIESNLLVQL
mgnify:CR=1 FL=1